MTVRSAWVLNSSVSAPGQTRQDTRLAPLGTMTPSSTDALTSVSGLVPGPSTGPCNLSMSGMNWSLSVGRGSVQGTSAQGAYPVVVTAADTGTIANGHATLDRIDTLWLLVLDNLIDSSGNTLARVEYTQGTPAASPTAPTAPASGSAYLRLWDIKVPANASAGNVPTWVASGLLTDRRTYAVAVGGIGIGANGNGAVAGQYRDNGGLQRWSGSTWEDRLYLNSGGRFVVGADTEWYRNAANTWRTPDSVVIDGNLTVSGTTPGPFAIKGGDTPRSNNTVLSDPDLSITIPAAGTYRINANLFLGGGSTSGNFLMQFAYPASGTFHFMGQGGSGFSAGSTVTNGEWVARVNSTGGTTAQIAYSITTTQSVGIALQGVLVATGSGTVTLQWAQFVTNATPTVLQKGSWLEAIRRA